MKWWLEVILLVRKHSGQTEARTGQGYRRCNRGQGALSGCNRDRDGNRRINYRSRSSLGSVSCVNAKKTAKKVVLSVDMMATSVVNGAV